MIPWMDAALAAWWAEQDPVLQIVFTVMALVLVGLLVRIGSRIFGLMGSRPVYGMRATCPRCKQDLNLWAGSTRCSKCDLRIVVRFED